MIARIIRLQSSRDQTSVLALTTRLTMHRTIRSTTRPATRALTIRPRALLSRWL